MKSQIGGGLRILVLSLAIVLFKDPEPTKKDKGSEPTVSYERHNLTRKVINITLMLTLPRGRGNLKT